MSDSVLAMALRLDDFYQDQDRAFEMSLEANRVEEVARAHIRATFDALTWSRAATPEESFILAVVLGAKTFGVHVDEVDDDLWVTMQRMLRHLIWGMEKQLTPEQFASLPKWVRDDPQIAMRTRILEVAEAAE